jgi:hypothetical protein
MGAASDPDAKVRMATQEARLRATFGDDWGVRKNAPARSCTTLQARTTGHETKRGYGFRALSVKVM